MDCIFCKIVNKDIPATIVYEDDRCVAFEDLNPQAPVHVLVVPKKHISTSLDIKEEDNLLIGHMQQVANRVATDKQIATRGFRTVVNCNSDGGQSVYHIHMHVLGGRSMSWPPG